MQSFDLLGLCLFVCMHMLLRSEARQWQLTYETKEKHKLSVYKVRAWHSASADLVYVMNISLRMCLCFIGAYSGLAPAKPACWCMPAVVCLTMWKAVCLWHTVSVFVGRLKITACCCLPQALRRVDPESFKQLFSRSDVLVSGHHTVCIC
jgi:hypothetical protein